jgi:Transport and Golgi organisation 2
VCTVSLVTWAGGVRVVANRDEQRSRPAALPPRLVDLGGVRAIMPIDAASGGTWIAVNEIGLVVALLNVNAPHRPSALPPRSRGEIVPALAALTSLDEINAVATALDSSQYAPFRLVCAGGGEVMDIVPAASRSRRGPIDSPIMFTSSGLGDHLVEEPRQGLFAVMVREGGRGEDAVTRQDLFHAHRWSDAPELSVLMERADARTVSRTIVEIGEERVRLTYSAPPDWTVVTESMPRQRADSRR